MASVAKRLQQRRIDVSSGRSALNRTPRGSHKALSGNKRPRPSGARTRKRFRVLTGARSDRSGADDPETVRVNQQMSSLANRKQLSEARALFESLVASGRANAHSYTIAINAHVRCADRDGAVTTLARMRSAGQPVGVVALTSVIKAHCAAGDLQSAWALVKEMSDQGGSAAPNLRTANTFLRGCLQAADVVRAEAILPLLSKWGLALDISGSEYLSTLLCQNLQMGTVTRLLKQGILRANMPQSTDCDSVAADGALYLNRARAYAFLGKFSSAKKQLALVRGQAVGSAGVGVVERRGAAGGGSTGGRRGSKRSTRERERSNDIYRAHRRAEIESEAKLIERFIRREEKNSGGDAAERSQEALTRFLCFPAMKGAKASSPAPDATREALACALTSRFGMRTIAKQTIAKQRTRDEKKPQVKSVKKALKCVSKIIGDDGCIVWDRVFGRQKGAPALPIKMEIGSGEGEWVVNQAKADAGRALWASLELRCDRAYKNVCRAVFNGVRNLSVISGDAGAVLRQHVPAASVAHVFVNHPEPPQQRQNAGRLVSQAAHMLNPAFFARVHRALRPGGEVTIVTDNAWYGRFLLRSVSKLTRGRRKKPLFVDAGVGRATPDGVCVDERTGGFALYKGSPTLEFGGHAAGASSYFDRIWKRSQLVDRFVLWLAKAG